MKTKIEQYVVDFVTKMRNERNLSQIQIAEYLEVDKSFIAHIENPKRNAKYNLKHINTLARVFECSPREFLPEEYIDEDDLGN